MSYEVRLLSRAEKQLQSLDSLPYQSVKKQIYSLRENPRPPGCRKLTNQPGWRVRAGDYRIVYEIDDKSRVVTVLNVGHRKEIYRESNIFRITGTTFRGGRLRTHFQPFIHAFLLLSFTCAPKLPSNNLTDTISPGETASTDRKTFPAASVAMA
jgi:mRNA interferase RelE/StbE